MFFPTSMILILISVHCDTDFDTTSHTTHRSSFCHVVMSGSD
jgi:hypothetical protein